MVELEEIEDLWTKQQLQVVAKRLGVEIKEKSRDCAIEKGWKMIEKVKQGKKQYVDKLKKKLEEELNKC